MNMIRINIGMLKILVICNLLYFIDDDENDVDLLLNILNFNILLLNILLIIFLVIFFFFRKLFFGILNMMGKYVFINKEKII